jgi:hypothetical protein
MIGAVNNAPATFCKHRCLYGVDMKRSLPQGESMPVISKFYGIVIRMMGGTPLEPRFHAIYGDSEVVVTIWPLQVVQGDAPRRVCDMVLEWATDHQQELLSAWNRCRFGLAPETISPLE